MTLEIACFSLEGVEIAIQAGADRVEFCHNYAAGGISPTVEEVQQVKQITGKPVFVMIRPRPGNYVYNNEEIRQMHSTIENMKSSGADGFVFGIVDYNNELNATECKNLISRASPLPCTLHRAFDNIPDKIESLQLAIDLGFSRILTSGGMGSAAENLGILARLVEKSLDRIIIVPGGGLRSNNIETIIKHTGASEYHSACIANKGIPLPDPLQINFIKNRLS